MKLRSTHNSLACLLLLLSSSLAFAGSATVNCSGVTPGAFTSITQAVASLPIVGPNSVAISGTCTENVAINGYINLTLIGNPTATIQASDTTFPTLEIDNAQRVGLANLTIKNGQGVTMSMSTGVTLSSVAIQGSGNFGIITVDSLVHMFNSSVTASTRTGIVIDGGSFYLDGNDNVSNNTRLGISASDAHLALNDNFGPNIISHNGISGVQIVNTSQSDISGDNEITSNAGQFGLLVQSNSSLIMSNGTVSSNSGTGIICDSHSVCDFGGTHIDGNGAGGVQVLEHSHGSFDGSVDISNNTGIGVQVEQSSSLTSGGNTIANNTGDGLVLNTLSALKFLSNDTITPSAGNLALNCNNGSMVDGDVSAYKPKKCGAQFQANPIH
jgi:hypothetical protein